MADGTDANAGSPLPADRYASIVAGLLGSRTDQAGARFDAAMSAALADRRLDEETARTLRWWQRASVRAVEDYAATLIPAALAARDSAEQRAAIDADDTAASWRQAQSMARTRGDAAESEIRWNYPARLVAVPQLADRHLVAPLLADPHPADPADRADRAGRAGRAGRADHEAAVRAAFRSPSADTTERKDDHGHARPATSA